MKTIKIFPSVPDSMDVKYISQNRVNISVYPFEAGYGITLAHPIRRLVLSSSVGYAVIGIKVDNVLHEFDTIKGVTEDIALFIINLKKLRFNIKDATETSVVASYSFSGEKVLTGVDFETDKLSVINHDVYVSTIGSNSTINFSIIINKGMGYMSSDDIRNVIPDTFIPIDAFFTPIKRVTYNIENILIKDDPNYEKVIFDIETDGRINPVDAFMEAISAMQKQMSIFDKRINEPSLANTSNNYSEDAKILLQTIDVLNLSARCFNCLDKAHIKYIGELVAMTDTDLRSIKNLGKKSYDEIVDKINSIGYNIGDSMPSNIKEQLSLMVKN